MPRACLGLRSPDEVYHVTVMPCYDKNLEASRSDFITSSTRRKMSTAFLLQVNCCYLPKNTESSSPFLSPTKIFLHPPSPPPPPVLPFPSSGSSQPPGSSAGSYLHSLILTVACTYRHPLALGSKIISSADYAEHTLTRRILRLFRLPRHDVLCSPESSERHSAVGRTAGAGRGWCCGTPGRWPAQRQDWGRSRRWWWYSVRLCQSDGVSRGLRWRWQAAARAGEK